MNNVDTEEVILTKGVNINDIIRKGIAAINTTLSAISLDKYFGRSSPKISIIKVDISKMFNSCIPNTLERNKAESDAKEILIIVLPSSIVEKNLRGSFVK
jgi:hypothetical protein